MKKKSSVRDSGEISTASLPDIVFLLLIFFLVTTTMDIDKGIGMELPPPGDALPIPKNNICNILVNATGEVMIDGEIVSMMQVEDLIRKKLEERGKKEVVDDKGFKKEEWIKIISLKTVRETPYQTYIECLDRVKLAGATKISIAEPEK